MTKRITHALAIAALMALAIPASSTAVFAQQAAAAAKDPAVEAANKAKVTAFLQAWMGGDGNALQALLTDDIEWTIVGNSEASGTTKGRAELLDKVLKPFGARFSKSRDRFRPRQINGVYADGDEVVAYFDGAGTANNGLPYKNNYAWFLTMKDGKVTKATAFFDSVAFNELWDKVQPATN